MSNTSNGSIVATNGRATHVAPFDPLAPQTVGEALATSVADTVESTMQQVQGDMNLMARRRQLQAMQHRLRTINADFKRMVEELNSNYSEPEEMLVTLYVKGCRQELLECYLAVNPALAASDEGRTQITELVDNLITTTLGKIQKPAAPPAKGEEEGDRPLEGEGEKTPKGRKGKS